jgi:small subunit ribosomal protein S6
MPLYECVFIARQEIAQTQVDALSDQFAKIITDANGKVEKRESWGLRTLTYRIRKNRKGHYMLFNIDAPAAAVAEMERNMRLSEDVLRYLTVKVETLDPGQSAILTARDRDDERGERGDRGGRFGDRPPRRDGDRRFGDRPPREDRGDRPPREDRGDRPPRRFDGPRVAGE